MNQQTNLLFVVMLLALVWGAKSHREDVARAVAEADAAEKAEWLEWQLERHDEEMRYWKAQAAEHIRLAKESRELSYAHLHGDRR